MFKNITIILKVLFTVGYVTGNNKSAGHLLYEHLMTDRGYNPNVRPVLNTSETKVVNISLDVISLFEFNEVYETLTVTAKLKLYWFDEYLAWDPTLYNGLQSISIPQNDVWKPDITLENSIERYHDMGGRNMYVLVHYNGRVKWKPIEVFRSTCSADVTKFPIDTQKCCLNFEAWSHSEIAVKIINQFERVILHSQYDGHPEWKITDSTAEAKRLGDDNYVIFCLSLKRQSSYVMLNMILPISLLSLLNSCVFFLPASCGEKASFSVTVFLSLSVFLTMVSELLPKASDNVSMFNLYVFIQVLISTMVTVTALVQIRFHHRSDEHPVPTWLMKVVRSRLKSANQKANSVDGKLNKIDVMTTKSEIEKHDHLEEYGHVTWRYVADWMDPVMFIVYTCLNIGTSIVLAACAALI